MDKLTAEIIKTQMIGQTSGHMANIPNSPVIFSMFETFCINSCASMSVPLTEPTLLAPVLNVPLWITSANTNENNAKAMIIIRKNERCLILDKTAIFICV